jgi:hypothetical protein
MRTNLSNCKGNNFPGCLYLNASTHHCGNYL